MHMITVLGTKRKMTLEHCKQQHENNFKPGRLSKEKQSVAYGLEIPVIG